MLLVDALAHRGVEGLQVGIVGQQLLVSPDDILIITDGRARLSISRMEFVDLGCSLVDEGQHRLKGYAVTLQYLGGQGIAVIDEVTGEDSCQVQIASLLTVEDADFATHRRGQALGCLDGLLIAPFYKKRYAREGKTPLFREGLGRIDNTVVTDIAFED